MTKFVLCKGDVTIVSTVTAVPSPVPSHRRISTTHDGTELPVETTAVPVTDTANSSKFYFLTFSFLRRSVCNEDPLCSTVEHI